MAPPTTGGRAMREKLLETIANLASRNATLPETIAHLADRGERLPDTYIYIYIYIYILALHITVR